MMMEIITPKIMIIMIIIIIVINYQVLIIFVVQLAQNCQHRFFSYQYRQTTTSIGLVYHQKYPKAKQLRIVTISVFYANLVSKDVLRVNMIALMRLKSHLLVEFIPIRIDRVMAFGGLSFSYPNFFIFIVRIEFFRTVLSEDAFVLHGSLLLKKMRKKFLSG